MLNGDEHIHDQGLLYYSYYQTFMSLFQSDKDLALEYSKAVWEYLFFNRYENATNNPMIDALMNQIMYNIDMAQDRHEKQKADGKKGGRNKQFPDKKIWELKDQGLTNEEVAKTLNCSPRTVERANVRRKELDPTKPTKPTKP